MNKEKKIIIVVGPSGAGKSTFMEMIVKDLKQLQDTITYTTRPMRPLEKEARPYYFITKDAFQRLKEDNFFVESAQVHNNFYGTSYKEIEAIWEKGKTPIIDVDTQGARILKECFPQALLIFIQAPNLDALQNRLERRKGSTSEEIALRIQTAQGELKFASQCHHQIINHDKQKAYSDFKKVIEIYLSSK